MGGLRQAGRNTRDCRRLVPHLCCNPYPDVRKLRLAISAGSASLLDVVKALGEYLTAEEDELRTKGKLIVNICPCSSQPIFAGVEFLSLVIEQCPSDKMNRQSGRVKDIHIRDEVVLTILS